MLRLLFYRACYLWFVSWIGLLYLPAVCFSQERLLPPYLAMRQIEHLQEEIAEGNLAAFEQHTRLLAQISEIFSKQPDTIWQDWRNAHALGLYLFSTRDPALLSVFLKAPFKDIFPHSVRELAVSYILSDPIGAEKSLKSLPLLSLDRSIGGQIALIAADLFEKKSPKDARRYLDIARLLMPGTLVEEAALRRSLTLALDLKDLRDFVHFSDRYVRRFPNSFYFSYFLTDLSKAILHSDLKEKLLISQNFLRLLRHIPLKARCPFLVETVQATLFLSHLQTADFILKNVTPCENNKEFSDRLGLYKKVFMAMTDGGLHHLDEDFLKQTDHAWKEKDRTLLTWVLSVLKAIHTPLPSPQKHALASASPQDLTPIEKDFQKTIDHAQKILETPPPEVQ